MKKCYIRYQEECPDSENTYAAFKGFCLKGIETAPFYGFGDIETLDDLGPDVGISGFIADVFTALKKIGIAKPEPIDYPEELREFLGRNVSQAILGDIIYGPNFKFVKPIEQKLFTGFLYTNSVYDGRRTVGVPNDTPVWISDPVEFVSEYRVFVLQRDILEARFYKGDWGVAPDRKVVEKIVDTYRSGPRTYAVDVGVTKEGKTLIVECNNAYALGAYGLPAIKYATMVDDSWDELTSG